MRFRQSPEDQEAVKITRLVDQPASGGEPPEIQRQVAAERRVARELRDGGPAVPDRLVHAVEAKVREAYGTDARRARTRRATGWRPAVAAGGLAVVIAALVIAAVGVGGGGARPSMTAAASLAFAPSTGPAPAARSATLLDTSYEGVTYPNYAKFSVPATGTRTDRLEGRPVLTVFYRLSDGTRLSYTVFSGHAIPLPADAKSVVFDGVPLHWFSTSSGLSVVTLVRHGRTCVLAAPVKPDVVLALAAAPVLEQAHA
ncbi:MAG TPA: hypothetical protein VMF57_16085 [Solirubrobacteraceae bacterium]|nr:hypothetical protein [Solirubrobacteraceae bacterium]